MDMEKGPMGNTLLPKPKNEKEKKKRYFFFFCFFVFSFAEGVEYICGYQVILHKIKSQTHLLLALNINPISDQWT